MGWWADEAVTEFGGIITFFTILYFDYHRFELFEQPLFSIIYINGFCYHLP